MKIAHVMGNTNWQMLAQQKLALLGVLNSGVATLSDINNLQGILHWIDAIQDAAEIDGYPVVFLTE